MENHNYLLGKTFKEALQETLPGHSIRAVKVNDIHLPITADFKPERVDVELVDDVIVKVIGHS